MAPKRLRADDYQVAPSPKKTKTQSGVQKEKDQAADESTPTKPTRGRPLGSVNKARDARATHSGKGTATPKANNNIFSTPTKAPSRANANEKSTTVQNADRSARRKSARNLIERSLATELNDDYDLDEENRLARRIWNVDDGGDSDTSSGSDILRDTEPTGPDIDTPSKRGPGRPKATRKRSPTPPQNLPPHERYFFQNRPGGSKTSSNTLAGVSLLSHDDYYAKIRSFVDPHASELEYLHDLHSRSFSQWRFELSQGFSICLYGWGSKRKLTGSFAAFLYAQNRTDSPPKILVVNGYISTLTARTILTNIYSAFSPSTTASLPSQPADIISSILTALASNPPRQSLTLIINSLDAPPLRRNIQPLLARLASNPHIQLLATCDTPQFPLLWDSSQREQFNWVFHDTTTFRSFDGVEISSVVDEVNEMLGRTGRTVKGKEGVGFVLKSLPENARNLYRVLIGEILAGMYDGVDGQAADGQDGGVDDEDVGEGEVDSGTENRRLAPGVASATVEYRLLYQKAVEEFICSSEMAFRTLLKEFHDHQMVVSRKDGAGTEMLGVPFRREEIEAILEDLMG